MSNTYTHSNLTIKAWAEADRPREKMLQQGKQSLTDAELLAILLGTGARDLTAVDLAQQILAASHNNLHELGKCSLHELQRFKGIGEAKAITIAAALELGRRRQLSDVQQRPQITSSRDAWQAIAPLLADLSHEEFWVLFLNRANRVIARRRISSGGTAGTVVDAKMIFRLALEEKASSIILVHNHPSGNLQPSQADLQLTRQLKTAGQAIDIAVLDHLIIAETGYYSFADEGVF